MKTKLLFVIALLFSLSSFAQLEEVDGMAVYFKAGLNASNFIEWDDNEPTETLMGPSGGMGIWIRLGKPVRKTTALALEGTFSGQGFKLEVNDDVYKERTTYFNAAVMLRQYFGHFFLTAGGERGWLMSAKTVLGEESEAAPEGLYKKGVWNGIGGIGVNFGSKHSRQVDFGLELTYKRGLSEIRTDYVKARHSVFNFSMYIPVSFIGDMMAGMQGY